MLTREEFNVLRAAEAEAFARTRMAQGGDGAADHVAQRVAQDGDGVAEVRQRLRGEGLLDDAGITEKGRGALEPYRVRNAVIMAAGMSSRFVPISYERPKGLLKVRGELLVERLIRQLREAGIDDVTVVVGYKRELFFYLEEQFGVRIVVNPDFASRNNNSTLMRVRDLLGNTYVCTSDIYFTASPFERYVWKACYLAEFCEGPTKEWCLSLNGDGRITGVQVGGEDAWYMTDQAYFDRAFAERFGRILEAEYDEPTTADKLWEQIFSEHLDELDMEVLRLPRGTVFEFDSLDELKGFDPLFLENVDSEIFDNICAVLGCRKTDIHDVYPLKQGLTNLSCHFATADGEYVYRHPGVGTGEMIDRAAEVQALSLARELGIDSTYVFEDPQQGWKISRFIPDCRELDPHDDAQLAEAMSVARRLHAQGAVLSRRFNFLDEALKYEALLLAKGPIDIPGYGELRAQAMRVRALADADGAPVCLTHNDFFNLNLLYDRDGVLSLIDWEYAGMSDYASDYGTFVVTCMLDRGEAERALAHYFGREPTPAELRHNLAYVGLAGFCWYVWSLRKESEGDYVGEWLYVYYKYAKEYLALALELYGAK